MIVHVNLSQDTYEYFRGYDLSGLADTLLEIYDFTQLPAVSGKRFKEVTVDITNEAYINLYKTLGPRSKKVSLSRLFDFAYNTDVLSLERFNVFKSEQYDDPTFSLANKAYKALLLARKYDDSSELNLLVEAVYAYRQTRAEFTSQKEKA